MKLTAVFSSTTGNNKHLLDSFLQLLQKRMPDLQTSYFDFRKFLNDHYRGGKQEPLPQTDAYVFACYSDCLQLPPFAVEFLSMVTIPAGSVVIGLNAHGGEGGAVLTQFHQFADKCKAIYVGGFDAKYFTNCYNQSRFSTYPKSDSQRLAVAPFQDKLQRFVDSIVPKIENKQGLKVGMMAKVGAATAGCVMNFSDARRRKMFFGSPLVANDGCVGCGKCVSNCPRGVIELDNGKAKFVHQNRCCACSSCLHTCPTHAISTIDKKFDNFVQLQFEEWMFSTTRKGLVDKQVLIDDFAAQK